MPIEHDSSREQTFDPATPDDWRDFRALGHRMLDDMVHHLSTLHEKPAWQPVPAHVARTFDAPAPTEGRGMSAVYDDFRTHILPYPNGSHHPRFFGWVQGNGTPFAMLAEMLSAGMNAHLAGFNQAPAMVERQVIAWFAQLLGMPGAGGLFVTGGTMANTLGLAVARHAAARARGHDVRADGVQTWPGEAPVAPMVFYGSRETHGWAIKAAEWLGLGHRAFRVVPCDADYRIDLRALDMQIASDRAAGLHPFCIIGTAGTVNTGATDDLDALADIAARESLWFHVDGAFGALLQLSPSLRDQVRGLDRADSVGFDLHKWGSMPFDCACVLVRDADALPRAFATSASYLARATRGVAAGGVYFADRGLDLTRSFKALKVWMSLEADGVGKLVRIIEQNVAQVQHLVHRIESSDELELLAPAPLNIACFRYRVVGRDDADLNALNEELLLRLQERGVAVPSSTILGGRFAIRVAHVNHRTRLQDIDALVDAVIAIGRELR